MTPNPERNDRTRPQTLPPSIGKLFWCGSVVGLCALVGLNVLLTFEQDPWSRRLRNLRAIAAKYEQDESKLKQLTEQAIEGSRRRHRLERRLRGFLVEARTAETFPIQTGTKVVSVFYDRFNPSGNARATTYVPNGEHRVKFAFELHWFDDEGTMQRKGYQLADAVAWRWPNQRSFDVVGKSVFDTTVIAVNDDRSTMLHHLEFRLTGHATQSFPIGKVKPNGGHYAQHFSVAYPNEIPLVDTNFAPINARERERVVTIKYGSGPGETAKFERPKITLLNGSMRLEAKSPAANGKLGLLAYRVWLESDGPYCIDVGKLASTTSRWQQLGSLNNVLEPYDGNGRYLIRSSAAIR